MPSAARTVVLLSSDTEKDKVEVHDFDTPDTSHGSEGKWGDGICLHNLLDWAKENDFQDLSS
jgi:hypothetical protein